VCGIAGFVAAEGAGDYSARARAMIDAIAYRGPDGSDVWADARAGIVLGHRRLAIVDLTPTGAQPMISADGRWVISYNGEVYNVEAIAADPQMAAVRRRGTSDTEVILESVAHRGIACTLADLNGMFAIALWDRATRTLHLIRDRLGIKPIFYATTPQGFAFASELKGLLAGGFKFDLDPASVTSFLRFAYVPAPHTIYRGVAKLRPGEWLSVAADGMAESRHYWRFEDAALRGMSAPFTGSEAEAEERLHGLLANAVSINMISDVPLGAFLSGGIDSSTVAALMVAARRGPVRTFSIGFPDFGYDESVHAKAVAEHLGTAHEELIVTADDALAVVPKIADIYDEPFADSSQIPTYAISKMTRARVTVALSGDGGDELFAGYNRYVVAAGHLARLSQLPGPVRRAAAGIAEALPRGAAEIAARLAPRALRFSNPSDKLKKLADILRLDGDAIYLRLISQCPDPGELTPGVHEHPIAMSWPGASGDSLLERMQLFDSVTYLPDDILQKVDRASMAVSLEVRPPLLDHRVVEFAWSLPRAMRLRGNETKWLLRRVLDRYVPRSLIDRPKMGFGVPLASWLRGPLRDWAEDLLAPQRLGGGILDVGTARKLWSEHIGGVHDWSYALWCILMFEAWRRRWTNA
jgi:asparagine synthase (glutamine-hydrolysing)